MVVGDFSKRLYYFCMLLFVYLRGGGIKEATKDTWVRKATSHPDPLSKALAVP